MPFFNMKRKIILGIIYIAFFLIVVELITKAYFLLPNSYKKIQDTLIREKKLVDDTRVLEGFDWDRDLNYKWKGGREMNDLFRFNLIGDPYSEIVNKEGFRIPAAEDNSASIIEKIKNEPGRKIICIGESWTMGWGVNYNESYPEQLQQILDGQAREEKYKVFNLGVISYTTFQGVQIMEKIAPYLKPDDVVVFSYQTNDSRHGFVVKGIFDKTNLLLSEKEFNDYAFHMERGVTSFKLLNFFTSVIRKAYNQKADWFWDYTPRISYEEYVSNYQLMIDLVKAKKARPMLLYHGLFKEQDYTAKGLWEVARKNNVPVINVRDALLEKENEAISQVESKYPALTKNNLNSPENLKNYSGSGKLNSQIVFRVIPFHDKNNLDINEGNIKKVEARVLERNGENGNFEIVSYPLNDSGTDGDEVAGDGIWSAAAKIPIDTRVLKLAPRYQEGRFQGNYDLYYFYYYRITTADNENDKTYPEFNREDRYYMCVPLYVNIWRGLPVGKIERIEKDNLTYSSLNQQKILYPDKIFTPISLFGEQYERSEFLHPKADGYRIFAEKIAAEISK